jgi:diguanylate cyclase (GGDEF)-like protein
VIDISFITALRQPGIRRRLTLAFGAVILVVALTLPVSIFAFGQISSASEEARLSSASMQSVAVFQRKIGDTRAAARDYANNKNSDVGTRMTSTLQQALDAARCVANPGACQNLTAGVKLPESEASQWDAIVRNAANAKQTFQSSVDMNPDKAVEDFDVSVARDVDEKAKKLSEKVAKRGLDAQQSINDAIYRSMAMIAAVLVIAILLAIVLATMVPRSFMSRLDHLRGVAHRLAGGELTARVDQRLATREDEIADLISDFNLMAIGLQQRETDLRTVQEQLQITLQQEQERATRDPLTGLRNHRYFQESLHTEIERCRRTGGHVTIAALDLDNFKQVNDRFGHSEGDAVLRRATKVISDNLRPYDLACRLGGEEFGIIFPEATAEQAKVVLDRIAAQILPLGPNGERLSFSGGLTTWPTHASSQSDLFHRADEASYAAKMAGKAQSLIYDPSTVASMDSEERTKSRSRDAMLTTATTLVSAVDQKDPYTRNHSELVAVYSATIARAMQLDEQTVKLVYRAGLLHDVGKIGISDSILVKNGELTHDEWIQLRMHPEFSYRILLAAEMEPVATWTRHHHEHVDGTGYPLGLAGDDIPLGSRIILVADAFESMTSDRIYRRALGLHQAIHELRTGAGAQFDAQVVETMVQLVEAGVFTQVMEQYGRVVATTSVDEHGYPVQHDPATVVAAAASAALDGLPPSFVAPAAAAVDAPDFNRAAQQEAAEWAQQAIEAEADPADLFDPTPLHIVETPNPTAPSPAYPPQLGYAPTSVEDDDQLPPTYAPQAA